MSLRKYHSSERYSVYSVEFPYFSPDLPKWYLSQLVFGVQLLMWTIIGFLHQAIRRCPLASRKYSRWPLLSNSGSKKLIPQLFFDLTKSYFSRSYSSPKKEIIHNIDNVALILEPWFIYDKKIWATHTRKRKAFITCSAEAKSSFWSS